MGLSAACSSRGSCCFSSVFGALGPLARPGQTLNGVERVDKKAGPPGDLQISDPINPVLAKSGVVRTPRDSKSAAMYLYPGGVTSDGSQSPLRASPQRDARHVGRDEQNEAERAPAAAPEWQQQRVAGPAGVWRSCTTDDGSKITRRGGDQLQQQQGASIDAGVGRRSGQNGPAGKKEA